MKQAFKTSAILSIIFLVIVIATSPAQAFSASHIDYAIHNNGDATVIADYQMSFGEKIALIVPGVKDKFIEVIKTEYGQDAQVKEINDCHAEFTIPRYGVVTDTYVQSPYISFENIKTRAGGYWFMNYMDIDYSPATTTITFDNGKVHTFKEVMIVPAITNNF